MTNSLWSVFITSGAAAGYLSLFWNFWRARMRLALLVEYVDLGGTGLRFSVSNRGSRPTTLTKIEVQEASKLGSQRWHNLGASPEIGGVVLPIKLDPGVHWTAGVFLPDIEADEGIDEEAIKRGEQRRSRLGWLTDVALVESSTVLMHFSHRKRPYRLRIQKEP